MSAAAQQEACIEYRYRLYDSGEIELIDPTNGDAYCRLEHAQNAVDALVEDNVAIDKGVYFVTAIGYKWALVVEDGKVVGYRVHVELRIAE